MCFVSNFFKNLEHCCSSGCDLTVIGSGSNVDQISDAT